MIVNDTHYHQDTPSDLISVLEWARRTRERIKITYQFGDIEYGYIGRSTGTMKIPLLVHNARSYGGPALLDHCIVRVEHSNKRACKRGTPNLYQRKGDS